MNTVVRTVFAFQSDFFNDDTHNPDCMDASDEKHDYALYHYSVKCHFDPTFRCEERSCRDQRQDACGDGQCGRGRCENARDTTLSQAKLSWDANLHLSFDCWMSLICLIIPPYSRLPVLNLTTECPTWEQSKSIGTAHCPEHFFFPAQPIALGHVRFLYDRNATFQINFHYQLPLPYYICYNQHLCESIRPTIRLNESSCLLFSEIDQVGSGTIWIFLKNRVVDFFARCLLTEKTYVVCPNSKPFRCANSSKCLTLNRLMDGVVDCIEEDDEQVAHSCLLPDKRFRFKCLSDDVCKDIRSIDYRDHMCKIFDKWTGEQSIVRGDPNAVYSQSFATVCNGFIDHMVSDSLNYTDEMNCELWPCNNIYTRCDEQGIWNCLNGADEVDCPGNPCRPHGHPCISLQDNNFTCLSLSRFDDGIVDCLGAFDERAHCRASFENAAPSAYRCFNETKCIPLDLVCYHFLDCPSPEDNSKWCEGIFPGTLHRCNQISIPQTIENWNLYNYMCNLAIETSPRKLSYFTLKNHFIHPIQNTIMTDNFTSNKSQEVVSKNVSSFGLTKQSINHPVDIYCKRGISVYANDSNGRYCLCPPAYSGDRCEYQNERVSLTMQFRTTEWSTVFNVIIMLLDNCTTIHSFELLEYLAMRDCRKKFNVNLLYSNRAKPVHRTYYVRIDVYDKAESKYVSSLFYPVQFSFLPVYRLSRQANISRQDSSMKKSDCPLQCVHGQCTRFDNRNEFFCRCFNGYSGKLCLIKNDCDCSPNSVCVGTANNRSICVCPFDRFGSRCYLKRTVCIPNPCSEDGQCVPTDVRISEAEYFCICRNGFTGSNCEQMKSRIEISFGKNIIIPQSILTHFIDITSWQTTDRFRAIDPIQITMITKIRFDQTSAVIYHNGIFHLIFCQFNQNYYLTLLQHNHTSSINISTTMIPENRCSSISHLLAPHIRNYSTWYRARFYHTICQKQSDLQCFYDDDRFMCLCDVDRFANCFKFDFKRIYNCFGNNYCENNGQCYQNHNTCPTATSCFCDECYYGTRCQFTSMGYGLSIDNILGYNIRPRVSFARQPYIIHVSTVITLLMFVFSIINGILSIVTFRTKKSLAVGTGVYLLSASIASCLTMLLFTIKLFSLIFSHISSDLNKTFLVVNCTILDMLLKLLLAIVDWLYACVAVERVCIIYKAASFNKKRSVKLAKRITCAVCVLTLVSYIHDPIYRHLLEDTEEQRSWCIVRYSRSMKALSSVINIMHFLIPLSINLISVIAIIILIAQQKSRAADRKHQRKYLWTQFKKHKHYLLSSIILIVVATPRLVISFMTQCMKSARHSRPYLIAYFLSFVSPLLIFIFFVLPSNFYRKQFTAETVRFRKTIRRRILG